jgi:hypothetical protein
VRGSRDGEQRESREQRAESREQRKDREREEEWDNVGRESGERRNRAEKHRNAVLLGHALHISGLLLTVNLERDLYIRKTVCKWWKVRQRRKG